MALIPKVPFTDGTVYTAEIAYLSFNQVFDDQTSYLGHQARLADDQLSNTPGQLKGRLAAIESPFLVSVSSGLTVAYNSGLARLSGGSLTTIASGLIVVANNATSYIWVSNSGVVVTGVTPPVLRLLLAKVTTVSGVVTALEDQRAISTRHISPVASSIKVFGGGSTTDIICTAGQVLSDGYYYFRDFTVPSGVSISVDKFAKIYCSGNVNIAGTILVTPITSGGAGLISTAGAINLGGYSGSGAGASSGSAGGGLSYSYAAQPYGSGGGSGVLNTNAGGVGSIAPGGMGGGGVWIESSGSISVTGNILTKGGDGGTGVIISGGVTASGGGGGSGGLIYLASLTSVVCANTALLDARGGSGGNAINNMGILKAEGGGGGAGGWVVLASPANNTTGSSIVYTGGAGGLPSGGSATSLGAGAGAGYGGVGGANTSSPGSSGKFLSLSFIPLGS